MFLGVAENAKGDLERGSPLSLRYPASGSGIHSGNIMGGGGGIKPLNQELSNPSASYPHPSDLQPLLPLQECVLIENYFCLISLLRKFAASERIYLSHKLSVCAPDSRCRNKRQIWVVKLLPFAYLQTLNLERTSEEDTRISPLQAAGPASSWLGYEKSPELFSVKGQNSIPTGSRAAYAKAPGCPVAVH